MFIVKFAIKSTCTCMKFWQTRSFVAVSKYKNTLIKINVKNCVVLFTTHFTFIAVPSGWIFIRIVQCLKKILWDLHFSTRAARLKPLEIINQKRFSHEYSIRSLAYILKCRVVASSVTVGSCRKFTLSLQPKPAWSRINLNKCSDRNVRQSLPCFPSLLTCYQSTPNILSP